jgi:hypothetical protein
LTPNRVGLAALTGSGRGRPHRLRHVQGRGQRDAHRGVRLARKSGGKSGEIVLE